MRRSPLPPGAALIGLAVALGPWLGLAPGQGARADEKVEKPVSLGVKERVLENGLTILTVEQARAPRVTCWLFFKTGSVNERPGVTGISHLFEHLMFKGTKRMGVRDYALDQRLGRELDETWVALEAEKDEAKHAALEKKFEELRVRERENDIPDELWDLYLQNGATGLNAFTSEDMTAYIVTLPSNRLELFMWMEADRVANAVFREFYAERDVVKEERRLDENSPEGPFWEELNAMFFMAHPYGWPVVGWMSDLDAITPEDCRQYFDIHYAPNNAVLVIVGDVKAAEVEKLAERYFGPIPRGKKPPPEVRTQEPRPAGERRLTVKAQSRPKATILFHVPKVGHADGPVIDVVQEVLSGKTGRLHTALVERDEAATSASASHDARRFAGVFEVEAYAKEGVPPEKCAEALQKELDRLAAEPVTEEDLKRAKNKLEADLLKQLEDPERLTGLIGSSAVTHEWRHIERLPGLWRGVKAEDVQRVAKTYLGRDVRTVGILEAKGDGE